LKVILVSAILDYLDRGSHAFTKSGSKKAFDLVMSLPATTRNLINVNTINRPELYQEKEIFLWLLR